MASAAAILGGVEIPIIQAPMVGASRTELAIAVCRAGGMGSLAAANLSPHEIRADVAKLRAATSAPFAVNLFVPSGATASPQELEAALERLAPWHSELGLATPTLPNSWGPSFDDQIQAILDLAPHAASFTFGLISKAQAQALQARDILIIGTATTVEEARAWTKIGADAICAQGFEAGGHRGSFLRPTEESLVGTLALVRLIRKAMNLPVIAAGGVMDGAGVVAVLALGAIAAQMGTAFLLSDEATTSPPWRRALEDASDDPTRLTRAFTGRHARGVENRFMRDMRSVEDDAPPYPLQNRLTQALRAEGAAQDNADVLSLWAGQGVKLATAGEAEAMVRAWWAEAQEVVDALAAHTERPLN
jgi:nitronate monooxygenase